MPTRSPVTKNEVLYSLNKPDDFILALVLFGRDDSDDDDDDTPRGRYVPATVPAGTGLRGGERVNYALKDLLASAEDPR